MSVKMLLGTKREMSQFFRADGAVVPVTILEVGPCTVAQVKTAKVEPGKKSDGYYAVQLGFGPIKLNRVKKPLKGHWKKAGSEPKRRLREVRLETEATLKAGDIIKVADVFKEGDFVDVIGHSKGRGYQGGVKRHGFGGSLSSAHGSKNVREPGSSGTNTAVGHVLKGKRMAGHMGTTQVTIRNLLVARVDAEKNLLFVNGAVPGFPGADIEVRQAKAKRAKKADRALRKGKAEAAK